MEAFINKEMHEVMQMIDAAIAVQSLQSRCAIALKSLQNRCEIAQFLCMRCPDL
jgi:hypothetical protein